MKIPILYEDEWICVVNKPDKLQTHATPIDPVKDNLVDILQDKLSLRLYPIHRLDRSTSGLLLLAKDRSFISDLQQSLQQLPHQKIYHAIVRGPLPLAGEIVRNMPDVYSQKPIFSRSRYRLLSNFTAATPELRHSITCYSHVELEPITGKTHQLRRHLSKISRPIVGDIEYGDSSLHRHLRQKRRVLHMLLHAKRLEFWHPYLHTKIQVETELPTYFLDFKDYCLSTL